MRHRKVTVKLGRTTSHRKAMFRNMVTSLFEHDRLTTTVAKAHALQPMAEKLITLAKRGDLHSRRQALSVIRKKGVTHKLFAEIKDRYMDRAGGYTSIAKIGPRKGDGAPMAIIELINPEEWEKSTKKKTKRKKGAKKKAAAPKAAETKAPKPTEEATAAPEEAKAPEEAQAPEVKEELTAETPAPEAEAAPAEPAANAEEATASPEEEPETEKKPE